MTDDMTTSHVYGCEHPGCHEVGIARRWLAVSGYGVRYLCAAHADKEEKANG